MNDPSGQQTVRPASKGSLSVYTANEQSDVDIDATRWMRLAEQVLEAEGLLEPGVAVEVSLLFVDVPTIANLNQQFMGKSGPTDVLSFPIDDPREEHPAGPPIGGSPFTVHTDVDGERAEFLDDDGDLDSDAPTLLGDVLICPEVALENAPHHVTDSHSGSLDDELALLVVHGLLHLLGMDHVADADAEVMEAREQVLLAKFHRPGRGGAS